MSNKKDSNKVCYAGIMFKLDKIEDQINKMHQGISNLKQRIADEFDPKEEICLDELNSGQALLESIEEICFEGLLEREPEGEA